MTGPEYHNFTKHFCSTPIRLPLSDRQLGYADWPISSESDEKPKHNVQKAAKWLDGVHKRRESDSSCSFVPCHRKT